MRLHKFGFRMRSALWLALWSMPLSAQAPLPGTAALTSEGDFAAQMVDGINDYLLRATVDSETKRPALWKRDFASKQAYERSVAPNRERLKRIIGAVDPRVRNVTPEYTSTFRAASLIAKGQSYKVHSVRWPVLEGVSAEGLLLQPDQQPSCRIVALPDADWSPEMLAGIVAGVEPPARRAPSRRERL